MEYRNIYKIGFTGSLDARLHQLNCGSAYDFRFVFTFVTAENKELEKHLHKTFEQKRFRREFFELDSNDLEELRFICKDFIQKKI